jgi:cation diffusion facilitator CzcD-associated flavoprotein CzcO
MTTPRELRFAIIGAGMAGILSGIRLQEAGLTDFTIYEKADRFGGTWRENTYPGLACDVPSHLYSYSFAPNPEWSHRFSPGDEIRAYFERVAADHGLAEHARFGEGVVRCEFVDGRWLVETTTGRHDAVDVVIAATGVLHHPNLPQLAGLEDFEGALFHSARWDHAVPIDGRRVGIVGTGSSAVQIVGAIVDRTAKLSLFQRSAQWIMPQENPSYSEAELAEFRRNPELVDQLHADMALLFSAFSNGLVDANSPQMKVIEDACLANLEQNVRDPLLREKLRPNYKAACKRLVMSGDFYRAIQQPQAEVVTEAIERVEAKGARTRDGRLHELDVLVLATGFHVDRFLRPIRVVGSNGLELDAVWEKRPSAYLSISIPGFPNFFMLNGPNGPVGNFSLIEVAELQMGYVLQVLDAVRAGRCDEAAPSAEAMARFDAERRAAAAKTIWNSGCKSWYLDQDGLPTAWPWTFDRFREEMAKPRFADYETRARRGVTT